jgi:type IV secretory pathway protease TraF
MSKFIRKHTLGVLIISVFATVSLTVPMLFRPVPRIIWNASASVPTGLYFVEKRPPKVGEIAVIRPSEWVEIYASARGYLPLHTPLLKSVRATKNSIVCRFGRYVFINGNVTAQAKYLDKNYRVLPIWKGCWTLKSDEIFVLGMHRDSFDSRYFGPINRTQVLGTAIRAADLFK